MRKFFIKIVIVLICTSLIVISFFFFSTKGIGTAFDKSYVSVFEVKYNQLARKDREPSVILVGGSNLAFGIDQNLLAQKLSKPILNTGLHAGFNPVFMFEIIRDNVKAGDTIVLALEHDAYTGPNTFKKIGASLVMQAIDSHISIYKYIPITFYPQIIDELIPFTELKVKTQREDAGCRPNYVYTRCSFDGSGQMIFPRNTTTITDQSIKEKSAIKEKNLIINEYNIQYLVAFVKEMSKKGVDVILVGPALARNALIVSEQEYYDFYREIANRIGVKLVGDPNEYTFELEYIYDTIYHLNSKGEQKRTNILAYDLINYFKNNE